MSTPVELWEIRIHAPGYQSATPCEQIAGYLRSLPGVRAENETFVVQEKDNNVSAVVFPAYADAAANGDLGSNSESTGTCNCIVVRVEKTADIQTWRFLAAFVFCLARWTGWQVYEGSLSIPFRNERALLQQRAQENAGKEPTTQSGAASWSMSDFLTVDLLGNCLGDCLEAACASGCWFVLALLVLGTPAAHAIFH